MTMQGLDLRKLQQIVEERHESLVEHAFGRPGMDALRRMSTILRALYGHLEVELIRHRLVVVVPIDLAVPHTGPVYNNMENLASDLLAHLRNESAFILLGGDGNISWSMAEIPDLDSASSDSIIYIYQNEAESILAKGISRPIVNPSALHVSIFAISTFKTLESALDDYRRRFVKTSGCMLFQEVWDTPDRLLFRNKPESIMRNSLYQFLHMTVRDAEVRMEAIVDASHPVDIMVKWNFTTRLALIEIKWVGKAVASGSGVTAYSDARARSGAAQLEQYLNANEQQVPNHTARGYLVVIDGRRRGVSRTVTAINRRNGFHYEYTDLVYSTPRHTARIDFADPIRMFAEPICRLV